MPALSLDHWNVYCKDLKATVRFYERYVGLKDGDRPPFNFPGAWLYAGEKDVVHLIEVAKPQAPSDGSALDHFAFDIADYDEALRRVTATGLKFYELAGPGTSVKQIFVTETNGVSVELNWKGPTPRG